MKEQYRQNIKIVYLYWDSGRFREVFGGFRRVQGGFGGFWGKFQGIPGGGSGFYRHLWDFHKRCGALKSLGHCQNRLFVASWSAVNLKPNMPFYGSIEPVFHYRRIFSRRKSKNCSNSFFRREKSRQKLWRLKTAHVCTRKIRFARKN